MSRRIQFIHEIFRVLNKNGISFVVLRNYDSVFTAHDIDILVEEGDINAAFAAGQEAAQRHGFQLVQQARFINWSFTWWDGGRDFVRLDVDASLRWKVFQVIPTRKVLAARVPREDFWVPCPEDEAAGLRLQLAGKEKSEERYTRRLAELGETFRQPQDYRREIILKILIYPRYWLSLCSYLFDDSKRWIQRFISPVGASLFIASTKGFDTRGLSEGLSPLFPKEKKSTDKTLSAIRKAIFKGGFVSQIKNAGDDTQLTKLLANAPKLGVPERQFFALAAPNGNLHLAHAASGFMNDVSKEEEATGALLHFICSMLSKNYSSSTPPHGRSILLAGVDGAGKTTFARNLCIEAGIKGHFHGCRYFHWIPNGKIQFPWPALSETPKRSHIPSLLSSSIRLLRNVLRVSIAWNWHVKPLLKQGKLIILDRFIVNYWLDPVSVKFSGRKSFLEFARWFFPKPDLLIALDTDASVLCERKSELTLEQMHHQQKLLAALPELCRKRLDLDASRAPKELAAEAFDVIATL